MGKPRFEHVSRADVELVIQEAARDGTLGEPNDVACTGLERKMGLHGSATCQLHFGESGRCRAFCWEGRKTAA